MATVSTPYRKTIVTVNEQLPECAQPLFMWDKPAVDMAVLGGEDAKSNVQFTPGVGWQLRSYQRDASNVHERTVGQSGHVSGGFSKAADHESVDTYAQRSLSGVVYSGTPSSGAPMIIKRVGAGESWDKALDADQTAFASPNPSGDTVDMDRVAVGEEAHRPDENLQFRFSVPGSMTEQLSQLMTIMFCGPAGSNSKGVGIGQYALKLFGSGYASLYERASVSGGDLTWVHRAVWQWADPNDVRNAIHIINIATDAVERNGRWSGSKIVFLCNTSSTKNGLMAALTQTYSNAVKLNNRQNATTYSVPRLTQESTVLAPIRIDARRDIRVMFSVSLHEYVTSGTLTDDVFSLPFYPTGDTVTTYVEWYGYVPEGTTLDVRIFRADDDTEVTSTSTITDDLGGQRTCVLIDNLDQYYLKATFGTTNVRKTPTLVAFRVIRDEVIETPDIEGTELEFREVTGPNLPKMAIDRVSIQGQSADSNDESATFTITDLVGDLTFLGQQGRMPVKIETTYDSGQINRTCLFRGYAQRIKSKWLITHGEREYPGQWSAAYDFECVGVWLRLQEALMPTRWTWIERDTGDPSKVTDAIRYVLQIVGVPSSMLDIPDLDVRFFVSNSDDESLNIEPGSPVAQTVAGWARDYLGAWIIFDENAGPYGMIRLLEPKSYPYHVVARFDQRHPGNLKMPHVSRSYGSTIDGEQTILHTFIEKDSLTWTIEPPEGNIVTVYGATTDSSEGGDAVQLTTTLVNPNSYNFANLSTDDPNYPRPGNNNWDYIGQPVPIRVYDGSLSTQAAVTWVARRVLDYACHGQKVLTFNAPLEPMTDSEDTQQSQPRKLHFYDIVEVYDLEEAAWQTYIVRRCDPSYVKDGFQFARFELVRSSIMDEIAAIRQSRIEDDFRRMLRPFQTKLGDTVDTNRSTRGAGAIAQSKAAWMTLPQTYSEPAQVLDSAAPEFGQSIFIWGLDVVGSASKPIGGPAA